MGEHVIEIGARVPRTVHPHLSRVALRLLALFGWRLDVHMPDEPKLVVLAAPHTSNWDGLLAMFTIVALQIRLALFIKHTAFDGILGRPLRKFGAIPIDRRAPGGVIGQTVEAFRSEGQLLIGLAPEGTRKRVERWKRGFYLIANEARVPIVCCYIDYARKVIGTGLVLQPTGDYGRDLQAIQAFYRTVTPKRPERFAASG
jgi:1-acyl-sn-glycerol-3-phosphate acyltransferase